MQEQLLINDDVIVDVGASNVEQFVNGMRLFAGSIDDFDLFIVPVTPEKKQQIDTVTTVDTLLDMGVDAEKIKIVFNKVQADMSINDEFYALIQYLTTINVEISVDSFIPESTFFESANEYRCDIKKDGRKIVDVKYTVQSGHHFVGEQKAANKRDTGNKLPKK